MSHVRAAVVAGVFCLLFAAARAHAQPCPYPNNAQSFTIMPGDLSSLPGRTGVMFTQSVTVSGGSGGYFYQLTGGAFPPGISMPLGAGTATNTISGTPTMAGSYSASLCIYPYDGGRVTPNCLCTPVRYNFPICASAGAACLLQTDCCSGLQCSGGHCASPPDAAPPDAPPPPDAAVPDAPGPDAPSPPDAPPMSDGPTMSDAAISDAASPDAMMSDAACFGLNQTCQQGSECCDGLDCEGAISQSLPGHCCAQQSSSCTRSEDCCALGGGQLLCDHGTCQPCHDTGQSCQFNSECCGNQVCHPNGCGVCSSDGQSCLTSSECCNLHGCELGHCCGEPGQQCAADNDCCLGSKCAKMAGALVGSCVAPPPQPDGCSACAVGSRTGGKAGGFLLVAGVVALVLRGRRRRKRR